MAASPKGPGWKPVNGDFFIINDFEIYDANDNQIWFSRYDGLGYFKVTFTFLAVFTYEEFKVEC